MFDCESFIQGRLQRLDRFAQEWTKINAIQSENLENINRLMDSFRIESSHNNRDKETVHSSEPEMGTGSRYEDSVASEVEDDNNHDADAELDVDEDVVNVDKNEGEDDFENDDEENDSSEFYTYITLNSVGTVDECNVHKAPEPINSITHLGGELSSIAIASRAADINSIAQQYKDHDEYCSILYRNDDAYAPGKWHRQASKEYSSDSHRNCKQSKSDSQRMREQPYPPPTLLLLLSFNEQKPYFDLKQFYREGCEAPLTDICENCRDFCDFCDYHLRYYQHQHHRHAANSLFHCEFMNTFRYVCASSFSSFSPYSSYFLSSTTDEIFAKLVFLLSTIRQQSDNKVLWNYLKALQNCAPNLPFSSSLCYNKIIESLWKISSTRKTLFEDSVLSTFLLLFLYSLRFYSTIKYESSFSIRSLRIAELLSILSYTDSVISTINYKIFKRLLRVDSLLLEKTILVFLQDNYRQKINNYRRKANVQNLRESTFSSKNEWKSLKRHPFVVVNRLRSITQQLRYHSQTESESSEKMKTFERFKNSKAPTRDELSPTTPTAIGKPPECKSSASRRQQPLPPPPPPPHPPSLSFAAGSGTSQPVKTSPLSIFWRKSKLNSVENNGIQSSEAISSTGNNSVSASNDETLSPIDKDFKAASTSPPTADYLQHRPSCPSVSADIVSAVIMRDNSSKDRSKQLSRASYHPNSTTNLLENPNPNSSRERGYGALPTRASSSFTSTREKDAAAYPKYCSKRRFRGPYIQLLESKMRSSTTDNSDCESTTSEPPGLVSKLTNSENWRYFFGSDSTPKLSFTEELLRETMKRRKELDQDCKNIPFREQAKSKSSSQENLLPKPRRPNSIKIKNKAGNNDNHQGMEEAKRILMNKLLDPETDKEESKTINKNNDNNNSESHADDIQEESRNNYNNIRTEDDSNIQFTTPDGTSIMDVIGQHLDTRTHIVGEMYDLEKSYCEFLRSLFVDLSSVEHSKENEQNRLVDVILSRLPSVMEVHSKFLEQLRRRMTQWANDSQIGDLFEQFRTPIIDDFYEVMVCHLPEFPPILKQIWKVKNAGKNNVRCKIAPEDMLIRIIQRMPQYKTLLDRLLKNTPTTHNDYGSLKEAFALICQVLERMNTRQKTVQTFERMSSTNNISEITTPVPVQSLSYQDKNSNLRIKDIENLIDGLSALNIRSEDPIHLFDNITIGKKKRSIILLDTNILICENKRRTKSSNPNSNIFDGRYKLEQNIEIEKIDLRCQCWQNYLQQASSSFSTLESSTGPTLATPNHANNITLLSASILNNDNNIDKAMNNLKISNQLQQTVHSEAISTNIGCGSCIETLEADVKTLTKLKASINEIASLPIRNLMKDNLNEIQDTVYRQLMTMHNTILNCSLDTSVDLYQVSPCLNHSLTDQNLVELLHYFEQQSFKNTENSNNSSTSGNTETSTESSRTTTALPNLNFNLLEAFEHQTKYRLTHLRCPQHQPSIKPLHNLSPLLTLSFSCSKKRAYFETVLLCLRARLFKTRLVLNSVHSIPYEKTRLTLQFRCAGAALGTNNVWICTSDRGQAQISVLVLSTNNDIEHSIVSCNTVATNQILSISSVPGLEENSEQSNALNNTPDKTPTDRDCDKDTEKNNDKDEKMLNTKDEKVRSNSIQMTSFFQNLKNNKSHSNHHPTSHQHNYHRSSRQFEPNTNLLSPDSRPSTVKHPTMWFATADQQLNIYSCYDNIRTGKHKLKIPLEGQVHAIQYYSERVFVALSNSTVAIFHRDATGFWQSEPTLIENTLCNKLCVVNNTSGKEQLWAASLNVVTIRDVQFNILEETVHMHENEKIATMVSDGRTIVLTLVDSCDVYRYSTLSPYQHLCTISIGPFVDKALSSCDQIIRFHKLACLKISDLHAVQNRIWIGTSAGVLLVLDVSNTIHIVPDGFTGRVSFIVSTKLDNGQTAVLSGGDGRERFKTAPGTVLSPMAGPAELYNFMSFCSSAPNPVVTEPVPVPGSATQTTTTNVNNPASISLPNSPLHSSHTAQIMIRRAIPSRNSQLSPSTSSVSRTSDGSMTSGVSSAGTILSCDSIETRELNSDTVSSPLRSGTATTGTPNSYSNTPTSASQTADSDFHPTWGSEDSQSYLLVWKL